MNKFYISIFVGIVIGLFLFSGIAFTYNTAYKKGYAAGAGSLSDKHISEVCMQWLFQSDLESAKRKVCKK